MGNLLTIDDALKIIRDRAQWCREEGESDMRNILHTIDSLKADIAAGLSRDEIIAKNTSDEDEE